MAEAPSSIYQHALEQLAPVRKDTVFVGDDLNNDIIGPKASACARHGSRSGRRLRCTRHQDFRSESYYLVDLCVA